MSIHFGDWLAGEIAKLGINQAEFARRAEVPLPTLRTWLKTARSQIRGGNLEKLSQALSKPQDEIRTKLRQAYYERGDQSMFVPIRNRPGERLIIRPVTIVNTVSAAKLIEKTNYDYPPGFTDRYVPAPTDDPDAFALIVDGDCMAPDYLHGEIVIFSPLEVERYGVVTGKDYAIQLDGAGDAESTFKRVTLDARDDSVFVLNCVNPKFKGPERIKRERVVRLARAIWVSRAPAKGSSR
jgi:phage repressor protein C with HTH and peptisase S24 domain